MNKKELVDALSELENEAQATVDKMGQIQKDVAQLTEENHALRMENQHLRDRLEEEIQNSNSKTEPQKTEAKLTKSRLNLENIYEDGFHVCNLFFGQRRVEDGPCAFCLDVIYGDRTDVRKSK